jgi:hypothetical protein
LQLKVIDGFEGVVKAAANGEIDVFAMDSPCAKYYLQKYRSSDEFYTLQTLYVGKFCAGVMEGNLPLLHHINRGIEQIHKEEIENILEKWLNQSGLIPQKVVRLLLAIAVIIIAITVLAGLIILKFQVRNRTFQLDKRNRELRESEERYKRLSEVTTEGITFHDNG